MAGSFSAYFGNRRPVQYQASACIAQVPSDHGPMEFTVASGREDALSETLARVGSISCTPIPSCSQCRVAEKTEVNMYGGSYDAQLYKHPPWSTCVLPRDDLPGRSRGDATFNYFGPNPQARISLRRTTTCRAGSTSIPAERTGVDPPLRKRCISGDINPGYGCAR